MRMRRARSTSQKDEQAASQPRAEAMEPTSVMGTRMESPRSNAIRVPAVMAITAAEGVRKRSWILAKRGETVRRRA